MANYSNEKIRRKVQKEAPELDEILQNTASAAHAVGKLDQNFYAAAFETVTNWYNTWRKQHNFALRLVLAIVTFAIVPLIYRLVTGKFWLFPTFLRPLQKELSKQKALLDKQPLLADAEPQEVEVAREAPAAITRFRGDRRLAKLSIVQDERGDKRLGSGGQGAVFLATNPDDNNTLVAVKELSRTDKGDKTKQSELRYEEKMMCRVNNDYVVKSFGMIMTDDRGLGLMMEYVPNGNLDILLQTRRVPLDWRQKYTIANEMALGLEAIHAAGLVHADIKSTNIFVFKQESSRGWWTDKVYGPEVTLHIKIGDFGLSGTKEQHLPGGTLGWAAPELMLSTTQVEQTFWGGERVVVKGATGASQASDVYAMAMTLYQVATRNRPYHDYRNRLGGFRPNAQFMLNLANSGGKLRPDIPKGLSKIQPDFVRLIKWGWSRKPEHRPTSKQVVAELQKLPSVNN